MRRTILYSNITVKTTSPANHTHHAKEKVTILVDFILY